MGNRTVGSEAAPLIFSLPLMGFYFLSIVALGQSFSVYGEARSGLTQQLQLASVVVLVAGYIYLNRSRALAFRLHSESLLYAAFLIFATLTSIWSIDPVGTATYSLTMLGMSVALGLYFSADPRVIEATNARTAFAILLSLCVLPFSLGLRDRSFGFIAPNLIASYGYIVIVLAIMSASKWRLWLVALGLGLILFSEGRAVLVAAIVFLALNGSRRYITRPGSQVVALVFFVAVGVIFAFYWDDIAPTVIWFISAPLGISDAIRLDTSLTGRTEHWERGIRIFQDRIFEGYGFGTRTVSNAGQYDLSINAHSGAINAMLDVGLIGAMLFWLTIAAAIRVYFRIYHRTKSTMAWKKISFLLSYILIVLVEPNYLTAFHPISIVVIGVFSAPVFRRHQAKQIPSSEDFSPPGDSSELPPRAENQLAV